MKQLNEYQTTVKFLPHKEQKDWFGKQSRDTLDSFLRFIDDEVIGLWLTMKLYRRSSTKLASMHSKFLPTNILLEQFNSLSATNNDTRFTGDIMKTIALKSALAAVTKQMKDRDLL